MTRIRFTAWLRNAIFFLALLTSSVVSAAQLTATWTADPTSVDGFSIERAQDTLREEALRDSEVEPGSQAPGAK